MHVPLLSRTCLQTFYLYRCTYICSYNVNILCIWRPGALCVFTHGNKVITDILRFSKNFVKVSSRLFDKILFGDNRAFLRTQGYRFHGLQLQHVSNVVSDNNIKQAKISFSRSVFANLCILILMRIPWVRCLVFHSSPPSFHFFYVVVESCCCCCSCCCTCHRFVILFFEKKNGRPIFFIKEIEKKHKSIIPRLANKDLNKIGGIQVFSCLQTHFIDKTVCEFLFNMNVSWIILSYLLRSFPHTHTHTKHLRAIVRTGRTKSKK